MAKHYLLGILCMLSLKLKGTHIVGGEFELIHREGYEYNLNMIMYFDEVNGLPEAEDVAFNAYIFSKRDDELLKVVTLVSSGTSLVPYTNNDCAIGELVTRRIFYRSIVELSPDIFNDKLGYYVAYERCCRNVTINNIQRPGDTGNVFYMEFPPVVKNGEPFINSSPRIFPPLSDYACVNSFYYFDFGGVDPDGDSLAYFMAQPYAGFSTPTNPKPQPNPEPYPGVLWVQGVTTKSSIPGEPALSISTDGLLTVKPSQVGLFVFSVVCNEYRDGQKIGAVKRDFQMLVIDCPDMGKKPNLVVRSEDGITYSNRIDTVFVSNREEKCLKFVVKDNDGLENLTFQANPVNFTSDLNDNFTINNGTIEQPGDSITFEFCLPECPTIKGYHLIDIIAGDDACPLPLTDTVRLVIHIDPPSNSLAYFDTPDFDTVDFQILEGENINLPILAIDEDGDSLDFKVQSPEFDTAGYDMLFEIVEDEPGYMHILFDWTSNCLLYDFSEINDFHLYLTIDDLDYCNTIQPDSLLLNIHVGLPANTPPEFFADLDTDSISLKVLEKIQFNVSVTDQDNDKIYLSTLGDGFDLGNYGFSTIDTTGVAEIRDIFSWAPDCNNMDSLNGNVFRVLFLIDDEDKCNISGGDTIAFTFNALPPDNLEPMIYISDVSEGYIDVTAGDSLYLAITAFDQDGDSVHLYISEGNKQIDWTGAVFLPVEGIGEVQSSFEWITNCTHLSENYGDTRYDYTFTVKDNKCFSSLSNSIDLSINVKNRQSDLDDVFIPNVFTPNNDGINEFFNAINLPEDNCNNQFLDVSIFNRYGKKVFYSRERDFKWAAQNVVSGVYYYHINFSEKDYKGYIHVLF